MIADFRCKDTETLSRSGASRRFRTIAIQALRRLDYLEAAESLKDLADIRSNRLEKLLGSRSGQFSIRINDQWRICFEWDGEQAYRVEIVDYH